ncbi:GatB/YqeY domain-containing protein [Parvibium lacunae]|uniref:GatB/YqeY domain-containing protein n=1 Tax=Parvibium lacunae TaxID=1888893 RepID=A0A368L4D6_9BURK|nr:GatB/YqeY domain-containing protein [Parvibium lacunae]RCS58446.1 GatB/YqeY domain-containing protein [Parvibium lacunae]
MTDSQTAQPVGSVLRVRINDDMKQAMRAKETQKLGAIRLLQSALKQIEVDKRIDLTDADVVAVVEKEIKKRRDSLTQYQQANRPELAAIEQFEIDVLSAYLPQQLSADEIAQEVSAAVAATGAAGPQDMGKLMAVLKPKLAGKADMALVSKLVKEKLA